MRRKDREVTDIHEIEEILLLCKTCHVAMADGGMPYVVPLSYGYKLLEGGVLELYFHSALEGRKLDILRVNNNVCFEVSCEGGLIAGENACEYGYYYSSVIGNGKAVFIDDAAAKCEALSSIVRLQTGNDIPFNSRHADSVCVFKIVSSDFTGKRKK